MDLLSYVNKNKKYLSENPFVLIIGSGYHKQAFCCEKNPLTDWSELLKTLNSKKQLSHNYPLDFESIMHDKYLMNPSKQRNKIEGEALKEICSNIREFKWLKKEQDYPSLFFNSPYVSDVINLNFDLVAENIFSNGKIPKAQFSKNTSKKIINTLHYKFDNVTFWHPHGSTDNAKSILLSLRKYFLYTNDVEHLRKNFMKRIRDSKKDIVKPNNWFELLASRPVIICGASISYAEWDIWLALVTRYRMRENQSTKLNPIFMMFDNNDKRKKIKECNVNHFYPVTNKNLCFTEQWKIIEKVLCRDSF